MRLLACGFLLLAAGCSASSGPSRTAPAATEALPPLELASALQEPLDPAALAASAARLRAHLVHPDYPVREEATKALQGLGPRAVHYAALLVVDPDPELSWRIQQMLARIGWPGEELVALASEGGAPAAPFIATVLRERTMERAGPAIAALARIGGSAARQAAEALADDTEAHVRYHAARALGLIGDPRALPLLEHLSQDADQGVRFAAVAALRRLGHEEAYQACVRGLGDPARPGTGGVGFYNRACLEALSGHLAEACDWMARACQQGFHDAAAAAADPDLYDLRDSLVWQQLLKMMTLQAGAP